MWTIAIDPDVCHSVRLPFTRVRCAKAAERIDVLCGVETRADLRNVALDVGSDVHHGFDDHLLYCIGGSRCTPVALSVDPSVTDANLTVEAQSLDASSDPPGAEYSFERHGVISIRHDSLFTFIETDKPVYKPSDTGTCVTLAGQLALSN